MENKTFLICILNWGLGHATRCIPIINFLLLNEQKVIIAGSGLSLKLLKKEFETKVDFLELPDYNIQYGKGLFFFFKMFIQIPKILNAINKENQLLNQFVKSNPTDFILSDNRFGCYHSKIPSYFLTHQLYIKIFKPFQFLETVLAKLNFSFINKFSQCLIFDEENSLLSGELSSTKNKKTKPKIPVKYIGALSRMKTELAKNNIENTKDILIILSGPEPQRTILEQIICKDFEESKTDRKIILIRGTTKKASKLFPENMEIIDLANSETINKLLIKHQNIICRSGYSSILDLFTLNKKAILIATPQQTEQEYLAKHLNKSFGFKTMQQNNFSIKKAIKMFGNRANKELKEKFPKKNKALLKQFFTKL